MAIVAISLAPLGTDISISHYVAKALQVAAADGRVSYRLDPMFTTLQGDLTDCLEVCRKMHESLFEMGAQRVSTLIKVDDRRDKAVSMDDKVNSVMQKL